MARQPYAVQQAAIVAAGGRESFGFFMEQGLGKTGTVICEFSDLVASADATRLCVVCPTSFRSGWRDELAEWGVEFDVHIYSSQDKNTNEWWLRKQFDKPPMLIIGYEAVRTDTGGAFVQRFAEGRVAYLAIDESVQVSTHNALQTKAVIEIKNYFKYKRILTGKWKKQGPDDIWGQFRSIGLLDGVNYFAFRARHCKMGGFKAKKVVGVKDAEAFAAVVAPHVFEATKAEWTDLPEKLYTTREYKLDPVSQRHFDSMMNDFVVWMGADYDVCNVVTVDAAITKYMKLAQIQSGFIIDGDGKVHDLLEGKRSPRMQLLRDVIEDEVTGKVCIAYNHRHVFNLLWKEFGGEAAYIKGQMQPDEVTEQKRLFNNNPKVRFMLLQTRAAKYGHTLLGEQIAEETACADMHFFENTYSSDDRSQIEDRIHRHGQERTATYTDFVGTDIDRRMAKALQTRQSLFDTLRQAIAAWRS